MLIYVNIDTVSHTLYLLCRGEIKIYRRINRALGEKKIEELSVVNSTIFFESVNPFVLHPGCLERDCGIYPNANIALLP